jgi:uncharacterized membrane protein YfcA
MTVLYVALAGFLSWLINTVAGGGGEFIFISAVTYLIGAQGVAPVVTLGNLLGVPSRVLLFREHIDWGIVRWFLAGAIPGGLAGAWLFTQTKAEWLQLLIAIFLLTAPLQYRLGEREKSFEVRLWWFLPAGLLVAFFSGLIGGTGPVLNPLYLNYGTVKEDMIGTKSLNSFVMHLTKFGTYSAFGALKWEYLWYGISVGVVAIFANWLGKRWLERISVERFRRLVIWFMIFQQRQILADVWQRAVG